jgi:ADP-heptose:LPS heptosyltransferase
MSPSSTERPRKVLFFSHDGKLGDAIVNTAFVAGLKEADPLAEIHATVAGVTQAFWAQDARVARCWPLERRGWPDVVRAGLALRREAFDYIVTWQPVRSEKNKLLLWLARPGRVIDLRGFHLAPDRHRVEACAEALARMGCAPLRSLRYDAAVKAACAQVDAEYPPGVRLVLVNLFASDAERNVPHARAVDIVRGMRALDRDAALRLLCTNATEAAARAVAGHVQEADVINCDGNLERLFRLCARADLVVTPDTAIVHIASAFNRPVVGIYQDNPAKYAHWGPRSDASAVVRSRCPETLEGFSVEEVLLKVKDLQSVRN